MSADMEAGTLTGSSSPTLTASFRISARTRKIAKRTIIIVGILGALFLAAYYTVWPKADTTAARVTTHVVERRSFPLILEEKGTLKAAKSTNIICDIDGEAKILKLVPEGQTVKEGDMLVEFAGDRIEETLQQERAKENEAQNALGRSNTDFETHRHESEKKIRAAEATLQQAKLDLDKYEKADWPQAKADAELGVKNAKSEFERASEQLVNSRKLYEKKFIPRPDLLTDQITNQKAEADLQKAELALKSLFEYTYPKEIDAKQAAVREAEEELSFLKKTTEEVTNQKLADIEARKMALDLVQQQIRRWEEQKSKTVITAPGPGIVVYGNADNPWDREQIGEGKQVWKGNVLMQLPDMSKMHVVARVHESRIDKVEIGHTAEVNTESTGDATYEGTVVKIGAVPQSSSMWWNQEVKEYETEIELNEENLPLRPGGSAKVRIFIEQVDDVVAVPVQSVFAKGRRSFAFRENAGAVEYVEITVGRSNDQYVEVTNGLSPGDRIRLAVDEQLMSKLPEVAPEEFAGQPGKEKPKGEGGPGKSAGKGAGGKGPIRGKDKGGAGESTGTIPKHAQAVSPDKPATTDTATASATKVEDKPETGEGSSTEIPSEPAGDGAASTDESTETKDEPKEKSEPATNP